MLLVKLFMICTWAREELGPQLIKPFVIHLGESYSTNGLFIINRSMILKQALIWRAANSLLQELSKWKWLPQKEMTIQKRSGPGKIKMRLTEFWCCCEIQCLQKCNLRSKIPIIKQKECSIYPITLPCFITMVCNIFLRNTRLKINNRKGQNCHVYFSR